jgi:hypothetical protein
VAVDLLRQIGSFVGAGRAGGRLDPAARWI